MGSTYLSCNDLWGKHFARTFLVFETIFVVCVMLVPNAHAEMVDPTTLRGKVMVGYQGWFSCPDDKTGQKGWGHWLRGGGAPAVDQLPDTSEFPPQLGCVAPFVKDEKKNAIQLYSSQNPGTVDVQVKWLQEWGISGFAVQRYLSALNNDSLRERDNQVLANIRRSSTIHGRVFYVTYDISGAGVDWDVSMERDWEALVRSGLTTDPAYLHDSKKPVVEIWGLGFDNRPGTASQAAGVIAYFNTNANSSLRASVILGVPVQWAKMKIRKDGLLSWFDIYMQATAISPWYLDGFRNSDQDRQFVKDTVEGDVVLTRANGKEYLPVLFPGFSAHNSSGGAQPFDLVPRGCGAFLRSQIGNLRRLKLDSFYVAMFDEANEGTAIFKSRLDNIGLSSYPYLRNNPYCPEESGLYLSIIGALSKDLTR